MHGFEPKPVQAVDRSLIVYNRPWLSSYVSGSVILEEVQNRLQDLVTWNNLSDLYCLRRRHPSFPDNTTFIVDERITDEQLEHVRKSWGIP